MFKDEDLTNEERKTQKKLREVTREERERGERERREREDRERGKSVKMGYRKIQINGERFIWDKRGKKLNKHF
jgi:hypothetical protein